MFTSRWLGFLDRQGTLELQPAGSIKKDVKRKSSPSELKPLKFSASSPVPRAQTVIDVAQLMMPDMVVSEPSFPS